MESLTTLVLLVGVVLIALLVIGTMMARLYKRASKEIAFVRTGLGGQRVVLDGGALVLPVVHDHHSREHEHLAARGAAHQRTGIDHPRSHAG